jgi:hypothetical protein
MEYMILPLSCAAVCQYIGKETTKTFGWSIADGLAGKETNTNRIVIMFLNFTN